MAARRCAIGCASWPDQMLYRRCLVCEEPTRRVENIEPTLALDEALTRLLHYEFERYYGRYCAKRGQPALGPLAPLQTGSELASIYEPADA